MTIFLLTAPSGAGKTTIAQMIQRTGEWQECISHTTRPMRDGEVEGETYYFVSEEDFIDAEAIGELAESVTYDGNHYGITHEELERVMSDGKHVYIIVEYDGYKQVKELYPDAVGIFLHMSKEECLANMLMRGDSIEKALKRIEKYDDEMNNRDKFDFVIKNVAGYKHSVASAIRIIISMYRRV